MKHIFTFLIILAFTNEVKVYAQNTTSKNTSKADAKKADTNMPDTNNRVILTLKPGVKSALFSEAGKIKYSVKVSNNLKRDQDGNIFYKITTDLGELISSDTLKIHVAKNSSSIYNLKVTCKDPGFYNVIVKANLLDYKDTLKSVFGLNTIKIDITPTKPDDFAAYWQATIDTLKRIDPKYKIDEERALAVNNKKVYLVEMHSWGNATFHGWLTIPNARPKKIPVRLKLSSYLVKTEPDFDDQDFAVFTLDVRGHGLSKNSVELHEAFPLNHIENRDSYIYRAVLMDCVRAMDFIAANAKMGLDTSKIFVEGSGQGGYLAVALAGIDKRVKLVSAVSPFFVDFREAIPRALLSDEQQTPIAQIAQHFKNQSRPDQENMLGNLDYYDALNFALLIKCPLLLATTLNDANSPPRCSFLMFNKLKNKENMIVIPEKLNKFDDVYKGQLNIWVKDIFMML